MTRFFSFFLFLIFSSFTFSQQQEVTVFENLGFSQDGKYFLFGQYGSSFPSRKPFAELYFVEVDRNIFYPSGIFTKEYDRSLGVGESGKNALYELLASSSVINLRNKLNINHLESGRLIYEVFDPEGEGKSFNRDVITFEDFTNGKRYKASLRKSQEKVSQGIESSFFINVQLLDDKGDVIKNSSIGHPKYNRLNVINYRIYQVYLSPNDKDLLFVIEKENQKPDGTLFYNYMIEIGKMN